jgi:hypothetical protein
LGSSGRDEPVGVVIHICMETTQGISLYSYLPLKLAKRYVFPPTFYVFSSTKSENKRAESSAPGREWGTGGGDPK